MNTVRFFFPELLLLLAPLLFFFFWRARRRGALGVVRIAVLMAITLLAAVPVARLGGRGMDVVIVADLSRSMPAEAAARMSEIARLLEGMRRTGDRVGLVTFGRDARIERLPEERGAFAGFVQQIDADGSDLGGAIALAAGLIPLDRAGRLVVLSDGEANGAPALAAAQALVPRGLPIDYRVFNRTGSADLAVVSLDLPGTVDEREPFQFSAWVTTDRTVEGDAVLFRDEVEIARSHRAFAAGLTAVTFRDAIERPGISRYRLEVRVPADRVPENNVGENAVRVEAAPAILLVNARGTPDNLSRALAAGKLRVVTTAPSAMPRDLASLSAFRGVILENVPVSAVGPATMTALARFATQLGGGLLVTGGRASFGVGGYFKSELDAYLPVSMELKNEHRKLSLAMAVALDRSGSMAAPAGDGLTKMDLANLGTCAAIDTLGPTDEIAVVAVDSAAHVVTPLTSVEDQEAICRQVRTIQSMGGGIFTYTALVSAAQLVQQSDKGTRHIVLFADAADAEEPGDYERLLERLQSIGITVSVIGLGSESDADAAFLKDVATRGGGRLVFTNTPGELPRLFAQEVITVARSSFIDEATAARALPDMVLLGDLPATVFPSVDGYNLTYLRPGATMGVVTSDEYRAPLLAFWHRGLGRVAALTAEVDGEFSERLNAWSGFAPFAAGLGRWLLGGDPPQGVRASVEREGGLGVVRVELDPGRTRGTAGDVRAATAAIVAPGDADRAAPQPLTLSWVGEDTLEARFPLRRAGLYLGAVRLGSGEVLPLAPLSLPYSPELEPQADPKRGEATLAAMAAMTGGAARSSWDGAFSATGLADRRVRDLVAPLVLGLLLLHVLEIAGRRLFLFEAIARRLPSLYAIRGIRRSSRAPAGTVPHADAESGQSAAGLPTVAASSQPPSSSTAPEVRAGAANALARAKAKVRDRVRGR